MDYRSIGSNIRKIRTQNKLRQEDVAERANLSVNYVGAVERGERLPSLETFITILNAIGASADVVLSDVLENGYEVKNSILADKLKSLGKDELLRVYEVLDALLKHSKQFETATPIEGAAVFFYSYHNFFQKHFKI